MELLQLRYFCAAAQTENLSQAARSFLIPQSAMSVTISRLEKELGVRLFDRIGNRLRLNDSGRAFYEKTQKALSTLQDGILSVRDTRPELSGEVTLLVMEHRRLVTECIVSFKEAHPDVAISIFHDFYGEVDRKEDLRISSEPPTSGNVGFAPLLEEELVLAVDKANPLSKEKVVPVSRLREERFIVIPNSISRITRQLCRKNGFEPKIAILCDDPFYVRKYIAIGLGLSLVPARSWQGLFDDNIALVPLLDEGRTRTTFVYWNGDRYMPNAVRAFRDLLVERFQMID